MTATTPKTTPTMSERCAMVLTTGGAVRSSCLTGAALISLPRISNSVSGASTGKRRADPGSRNFGGSEGIFCPAGTSAMVAFWLNCSART